MKFIYYVFAISILFISCGGETKSKDTSNVMLEEPPIEQVSELTNEPEGLKLIKGMDCVMCHKDDSKLVGPSYQDIANKYSDEDMDMLAQKIIDGSVGTWGQVPMTPHSGLSKENAKKMVSYILTLKK